MSLARRKARRRLSLTSLIDVIFLLLLFFMLSSTFTRFAEVDLAAAGAGAMPMDGPAPLFVQLAEDSLTLNGQPVDLATLPDTLRADAGQDARPLLVSLRDEVTAQRLTDLLVALRGIPALAVTVLGAS